MPPCGYTYNHCMRDPQKEERKRTNMPMHEEIEERVSLPSPRRCLFVPLLLPFSTDITAVIWDAAANSGG